MESLVKTETLLKAKHIEITYDANENYLYCNWLGFQNKESVMNGCNSMLELLKTKRCSKVLNDNTKVTGPWQEASEWVGQEWFPKMEKAGLKNFGWIFSPNIFAELSAKKAMPASNVVKSFHSLYEAKKWLLQQ